MAVGSEERRGAVTAMPQILLLVRFGQLIGKVDKHMLLMEGILIAPPC